MSLFAALAVSVLHTTTTLAFTAPQPSVGRPPASFITKSGFESLLHMAETKENEVVELVDDDEETTAQKKDDKTAVAPFLSQGEISEEAMQMDWNDPKQARVMFYIILSLIPVLFLIPLMLGSRDLIPVDALPPVPLN
jgi:hypothetical protein